MTDGYRPGLKRVIQMFTHSIPDVASQQEREVGTKRFAGYHPKVVCALAQAAHPSLTPNSSSAASNSNFQPVQGN